MRIIFIALSLLVISGCATGYQSQGLTGGYTDVMTGRNTATVSFKSNAFTSMEDTRRYALRRAAEITLSNGYDYFLIENDNQYVKNETFSGTVNCTTFGYSTTCNQSGGGSFTKPRVQLDIRMFNGSTPNETGYFDARYLAR